ncbi:MAG TPA: glutaredoxin family protein [Rhodocyclaceae bacterium]|nr:glutaredoxin family protein [Rhodocyclaceae bacterium]
MVKNKPVTRVRLTLYGRTYCHLCDDMLAALQSLHGEFDFEVTVLDVDADPALEERYDERVPVLTAGEHELCHYHLDIPRVRAYLASHC